MKKQENKPENPNAFASNELNGDNTIYYQHQGMTLRDYFANSATIPYNVVYDILESKHGSGKVTVKNVADYMAEYKFLEADAMLKQREL